jgi:[acyl-carrier-protein] S-malonyltransferase
MIAMSLDPTRTAFVFPGQGSQAVGMGAGLAAAEPRAAAVFAEADRLLGSGFSELCWHGPAEVLNDTINTQPALLTHSVAVLRALEARMPGVLPACAAGHSLGEFSALVAAGSLGFADALALVRERGRAMKAAGELAPGGMAAVLGLETAVVEEVCREAAQATGGVVQVANDNCPGQVVISGDERALAHASEGLSARGARRIIRLAVSIPSHSPLMQHAQGLFSGALDAAPLTDPALPIYGNVGASPLRSAAELRDDLRAQLTSPVRWTDTIRAMAAAGVTTFLELGTGSVLCGLIRRIAPQATAIALDSAESFGALAP